MFKTIISLLLLSTMLLANNYVMYISSSKNEEYAQKNLVKINNYLKNSDYKQYKSVIQKEKNLYLVKIRDIETKEDSLALLSFVKQYYADAFYKNAKVNITKKDAYKTALKSFNEKDYKLSYKLFYELFLEDLENVEVNFYLGRSSFELKDYNEALTAYERIVIKQDSSRVQFEIARCYFMQNNYIESRNVFEGLKKDYPKSKITSIIDKYLTKIDKRISKHSLKGVMIVGLGYDSNSNNRATSDTFDIGNLTFTNSTIDETASSHQEIVVANHKYKYNRQATIKNDIMIFNKSVSNHSDKNVQLLSYTPAISYIHSNKLKIDYAVFANRLWYGKKLYLNTIGIFPKVQYQYAKDLILKGSLKHQKKMNQIEANRVRDSKYTQLTFGATKIISPVFNIMPAITLEKERKKDGTLSNVDFNAVGLSCGLAYKLSDQLTIVPKLSYKKKKYKDTDTNYNKKQTNSEYNLNLTATYMLKSGWIGQGLANYADIDSNIVSSKYKKYTLGINFIKPF